MIGDAQVNLEVHINKINALLADCGMPLLDRHPFDWIVMNVLRNAYFPEEDERIPHEESIDVLGDDLFYIFDELFDEDSELNEAHKSDKKV